MEEVKMPGTEMAEPYVASGGYKVPVGGSRRRGSRRKQSRRQSRRH